MGLKKNIFYNSILTSANYIFPLITYPYISRVLGVENIGKCNFVDSVIFCFVIFATLGVDLVGTREIARSQGEEREKVFSGLFTINGLTTLISLLILGVCVLYVEKFSEYSILFLIGSFRLLFSFLSVNWLFQGLERFRFVTIRTVIVRSVFVILVFALVGNSDEFVIYYILLTASVVVNGLINIIYARKEISFCFDWNVTLQLVKPIMYMGLYTIMCWLYNSFSTVYLGFISNDTEVGYYTTATKLYTLFLSLFSALSAVMVPRLSSLSVDNKKGYQSLINSSFNLVLTFTIPLAIYVASYSGEIIRMISGEGYEGASTPMQIIMPLIIIVGISQIVIMQILIPFNRDKQILFSTICGALFGITVNIVLVPSLGSVGAAISWVSSELLVLLVAYYCVKRYTDCTLSLKLLCNHILCGFPYFFILFLINKYVDCNSYILMLLSAFLCIVMFCIMHFAILKNELLIGIIKSIKQIK